MSKSQRLVFLSYNIIWWLPIALVVFDVWSYRTGAIGFFVITVFRALANLYRNRLPLEAAAQFPLRSP